MLITFATLAEASPTLSKHQAVQIGPHLYQALPLSFLITGIGYCHTLLRLGSLPFRPTEILNLGIVASLDPQYPLYTSVEIACVQLYAPQAPDPKALLMNQTFFPTITLNENTPHQLITTPMPVHGGALYKELANSHTFVDMEGYAVAFVAKEWNIPCRMVKVVSDFGKQQASEEIKKSINQCALHLEAQCAVLTENFNCL